MKLLTLAGLVLFGLNTVLHAQTKGHKEICETEAAKQLMGATGSCQVIIVPQKLTSESGMCIGRLNTLTCSVKYAVIEIGAGISINCGGHEEDLEAEASAYRIAALIKMENGKQTFLGSKKVFMDIKSQMFSISLVKEDGSIKEQTLELDMGAGGVPLSDTLCI